MKTFLNTYRSLLEGGNVFKDKEKNPVTTRIDKGNIKTSLAFVEEILGFKLDNYLGSTGVSASSGDIDVGVDATKYDKKDIANKLKTWAKNNGQVPGQFVKLSGTNVHFKTPIRDSKGNHNGEFVQLDLMFGNPNFQKWSMRGEHPPYKGNHRHILMASIAKAQGMKWSYLNGLVNRETNEVISQEPKVIVSTLLKGYTGNPKDLSIPSILEFIHNKYKGQPQKITALIGEATETLKQHYDIILPTPESNIQENGMSEIYNGVSDEYFLARLRDKIVNTGSGCIMESTSTGGRPTQHIEDLVIFEGMDGLRRALDLLKSMASGGHSDISLKWDGSPSVVFGRNDAGEFVFTDINGFNVKSYDGKTTSAKSLGQMFTNRNAEMNPARQQFIHNMMDVFDEYQKITPQSFEGYVWGDLLYYNTPPVNQDHYVFQPNTVKYSVTSNSKLGNRIGTSKTGIALHGYFKGGSPMKPEHKLDLGSAMQQLNTKGEVLLMPPSIPQSAPKVDLTIIEQLEKIGNQYKNDIEQLLDINVLQSKKMLGFSKVLYSYINQKVGSDMSKLGKDFLEWLPASKNSKPMQAKIQTHISENSKGFSALWTIVRGLTKAKNSLAQQLDNSQDVIKQDISGNSGRGEGYVYSHPDGPIKLVPRDIFTAVSKAKTR